MISGRGPRTTTIRGSGASRVIAVPAGESASLHRVGIAGGRAGAGEGGNILNEGDLFLFNARVTDGVGTRRRRHRERGRPPVAVQLARRQQHVDDSGFGGGIVSRAAADGPSSLQVTNSTVAFNTVERRP